MSGLSQSEENYLKAIYKLQGDKGKIVGTNDLAEMINSKASSVTDMIQRLSEKELISYERYKGCKLTKQGEIEALKTIRKHRLWETFLVQHLKFGWDEVHEIAEQLEHIKSTKLTDQLDAYLSYPKFDPHGDPIPNKEGKIEKRREAIPLEKLEENQKATIVGVTDSSDSFLKFLDRNQIKLGVQIKMIEKFEFDNSIEIEIDEKVIILSEVASSKLIVTTH